jgi:hypothetical protein
VSSWKFVRAVILPLHGKDRLSGKEESGWNIPDLLWESSLTSSSTETQHFLSGGELREINPCISLWFASLSYFLAYLICFCFDLLGGATCVCRGHYLAYDHLPRPLTKFGSCWKSRGAWSYFCRFSVVHRSNRCRATVWPMPPAEQSQRPIWLVTLGSSRFGDEKFKLVVMSIHPPLGDIKVLSTKWSGDSHGARARNTATLEQQLVTENYMKNCMGALLLCQRVLQSCSAVHHGRPHDTALKLM